MSLTFRLSLFALSILSLLVGSTPAFAQSTLNGRLFETTTVTNSGVVVTGNGKGRIGGLAAKNSNIGRSLTSTATITNGR